MLTVPLPILDSPFSSPQHVNKISNLICSLPIFPCSDNHIYIYIYIYIYTLALANRRDMHAQSLSHVWLSATPWTVAPRLLCPWDPPGKNTGVGCHFLLQGIFLTRGLTLHLQHPLHWLDEPPEKTLIGVNMCVNALAIFALQKRKFLLCTFF